MGTYRVEQVGTVEAKSLRTYQGWGDWGKATQQDASEGEPVGERNWISYGEKSHMEDK